MRTMSSPILTAVAWPYANGPRHIGHVSGFGVPSDVFSRYMRMAGNDVLMVSGTDEHGTAIQVQAEKEGLTPQQTADKYHRVVAEDLQGLRATMDLAFGYHHFSHTHSQLLGAGTLGGHDAKSMIQGNKKDPT